MDPPPIEQNRLRYREASPGAVLDEYVQCFAEFAVDGVRDPFEHRIMPDGCCHISYVRGPHDRLGAVSIVGPRMGPLVVPMAGGQLCWDLKLRPGAFEPLLRLPVEEVVGRVVRASEALPSVHAALQSDLAAGESAEDAWRVFAEAILTWLPGAAPVDPPVARAVRLIEESDGGIAVHELAEAVRFSERQLQRRFRAAVGLTPKQFARIRRFRSCVHNMISESPEAWGMIAIRHGYADQAHLTREFAELSGLPPTELETYIQTIEHGDVSP
jgi:AraC-like DNA-binding protein